MEGMGEGWTVAVTHGTATSFEKLKNTFRERGQAQLISYFDRMTQPSGYGHWTLAPNHMNVDKPSNPQLWCTWEGDWLIQDIIAIQDYKQGKGLLYPVTLLWFPLQQSRWSIDSRRTAEADRSILPGLRPSPPPPGQSPPVSLVDDDEDEVPQHAATPPLMIESHDGRHNRQISEAIPRDEGPNDREEGAVRKSGRARKPSKRTH